MTFPLSVPPLLWFSKTTAQRRVLEVALRDSALLSVFQQDEADKQARVMELKLQLRAEARAKEAAAMRDQACRNVREKQVHALASKATAAPPPAQLRGRKLLAGERGAGVALPSVISGADAERMVRPQGRKAAAKAPSAGPHAPLVAPAAVAQPSGPPPLAPSKKLDPLSIKARRVQPTSSQTATNKNEESKQ